MGTRISSFARHPSKASHIPDLGALNDNLPSQPEWVQSLIDSVEESHNLDLERRQSSIDVQKLAYFLFTRKLLERRRDILDVLEADPVFEKFQNHYLGPVDKLEVAIRRGKRLHQLAVKHAWSDDDYQTAADLIGESDPYGLHASLFLVTLRQQGAEEQHRRFLDKAERWEYIGCYAQTELGHGSNVRGLETTATWNAEDKTFTLHSPGLTAAKWWIGSLGKVANHAIVMAQLMVELKSHGPHAFMVAIRDVRTHAILPNVYIGDVGPKSGLNVMDNGFLLFNQLKIPHENMLARFSCMNPQTNSYERRGSPASAFATMTYVRSVIVQRAGAALARGVTIATRYSAVRRQFADSEDPGGNELHVLNYSTVQMRLLPLLATTYALHFAGNRMMQLYQASRDAKANDTLAELHATSCGLKALATTLAADGLETCRRACGGHGYSSFSGIGSWYADYLPATTWEGDNFMVTQQVARYVLKFARAVLKGDVTKNDTTDVLMGYVEQKDTHIAFDIVHGDDEQLVRAFAWRAAHLAFEALKQKDDNKCSWNSLLVDFWRLSTAHSEYLTIKYFYSTLCSQKEQPNLPAETLDALTKLFRLFALHTIETRALDFLSTNAMELAQIDMARNEQVPLLMAQIRPHAVRLVDAWMFPDWQLDSSLGRSDGRVYEDLFHRATTKNPRNDVAFHPLVDSKL
ncbi:fatty-acyl coenzyme A oxidase [Puttea exsequens]|nr:fatty-acyl coenzyme A oxidase [Puttea exsequens]